MPRNYVRKYPPGTHHPKAGGRAKGTPNRSTVRVDEMLTALFHDLQEGKAWENPHLFAWADKHPAEFYKIFCREVRSRAPESPATKPTDPDWATTWARASPEWRRQVLDGTIPYPDWMPPLETGE